MDRIQVARRHLKIIEMGCIACRKMGFLHPRYTEEHHLNIGGVAGQERRGPQFTIPLCKWHHRGEPVFPVACPSVELTREIMGPSLKLNAKLFRETFGDDHALLEQTNKVIGETP